MSANSRPGADPPRFDGADASSGIVCSRCRGTMRREYYQVDSAPTCGPCAEIARRDGSGAPGAGVTIRAALLGLGAAVVGAIVYYGVIALTGFEIGIVAILCGFIVGWGVRKGAAGRGARRLQVMAVALTYLSVGLAYSPLAFGSAFGGEARQARILAPGDGAVTGAQGPATSGAGGESAPAEGAGTPSSTQVQGPIGIVRGVGILLFLILALPVISIVGTLPGGLISAAIIFFGMQQAWRMTGRRDAEISGPFAVGTEPRAASA